MIAGAQTDSTPRYVATLGIAQCRCRRAAEHNGGTPLEPRRPGRCAFAVPSIGPRAAAGYCRLVATSSVRSEHIGTSWQSGCTGKPSIGVTHAICGRTGPVYWMSIHGRLADVGETPHFSAGLLAVISRRLSRSGAYAPPPARAPARPTDIRSRINPVGFCLTSSDPAHRHGTCASPRLLQTKEPGRGFNAAGQWLAATILNRRMSDCVHRLKQETCVPMAPAS
jgi:hypothetical protein